MGIYPKIFSSLILALCLSLAVSSCFKEEYEALPFAEAITETYTVDPQDPTSVILSGRLDGIDSRLLESGFSDRDHGFLVSKSNDEPTLGGADTDLHELGTFSENRSFTVVLSGVESSTPYYYRAFARVGGRTSYGNTRQILLGERFLISISDTITLYNNRAVFGLNTEILRFPTELTDHGFVYAATGQMPEVGRDSVLSLGPTDEDGFFSKLSNPLNFNATYQLRAYAEIDNQIIYSPAVTFKTGDGWQLSAMLKDRVVFDAVGIATQNAAFMGLGCRDIVCSRASSNPPGPWWGFIPDGGSEANIWPPQKGSRFLMRGDAVSFTINDKVYYGLGRVSEAGQALGRLFEDIWEYDPGSNEWVQMDNFPGGPRADAVAFVLNEKAYVGTGQDEAQVANDKFWVFDPAAPLGSQWSAQPVSAPLPTRINGVTINFSGRIKASAFTLDGKAYVGAGEYEGIELNDVWEFDPNTRQWTLQSEGVFPKRKDAVAVSVNNKGYIGLGNDDFQRYYDFWEFDPARGTGAAAWRRVREFVQSPVYPDDIRPEFTIAPSFGFVLNDRVFIGGPSESATSTVIWEYIPKN